MLPIASGQSGPSYPAGQYASVTVAPSNPTTTSDDKREEIHKLALRRFDTVTRFEAPWRDKAQRELAFVDDYEHWSEDMLAERKGRPCLVFDLISGATDQIINNMRQNPPEPRAQGVGNGADKATAEVIQGIIRNVDNDSAAEIAWTTAYEHAVKIGRGWVEIAFDYEDDPEHPFWQKLVVRRKPNPFTVYPDPAAMEFDYSDMRYCFDTETLDKEVFEERFPDAEWVESAAAGNRFESTGDNYLQEWFTDGGMRVANYWWVETEFEWVCQSDTGAVVRGKQKPKPPEGATWANERREAKRIVKCCKMSGAGIIGDIIEFVTTDEDRKPTLPAIPLVPVIGRESYIEGKRKLRGMVKGSMDANLAYDYARSKEAETISLSAISQWLADIAAIEGFQQHYADSNKKAITILPWRSRDASGNPLPEPKRISPEPASQAVTLAVEHAANDAKTTLTTWDPNLGSPGPEQSGRAISLRQRQGDNAHFNFADNLARSVRHATRIEIALIPHIYSEERELMISDPDGSERLVKINQQFLDPKTGKSRIFAINNQTARYHVTIGTGPSYPSRKAQQTDTIVEIGRSVPNALGPVLDLLAGLLDLPQEFIERWRPPGIAAQQASADGEGPTLQQTQQQLLQAQKFAQTAAAEVKRLSEMLGAKVLDLESRERIAAINAQATLIGAALKARSSDAQALLEANISSIQHRGDLLHDSIQIQADAEQTLAQGQPGAGGSQPSQQSQPAGPQAQPAGAGAPAEGQ
jgi:hypothetical protein